MSLQSEIEDGDWEDPSGGPRSGPGDEKDKTFISIMNVKRSLSEQEQEAYKTIMDTLVFQDANIMGELDTDM